MNIKGRTWIRRLLLVGVFLSAALLFQCQLILAKYIQPWFGSSPSVWITVMMFFQLTLVAGYATVFTISTHCSLKQQSLFQCLIAVLACIFFRFFLPDITLKPLEVGRPIIDLSGILLISIGLPAFLLSLTSPLFQVWFEKITGESNAYHLYAASNAGSFVGLFSYPFIIEPLARLKEQETIWAIGFVFFAVVSLGIGLFFFKSVDCTTLNKKAKFIAAPIRPISTLRFLQWLILSALGVSLMMSTTQLITQDISPIPLLWVIPLGLYLLSFILSFRRGENRSTRYWFWIFIAALGAAQTFIKWNEVPKYVLLEIGVLLLLQLSASMLCHVNLYRIRPIKGSSPIFYLALVSGGFIGSFLTVVVSPLLFNVLWEYWICLGGIILFIFSLDPLFQRLIKEGIFNSRKGIIACFQICLCLILFTLALLKFATIHLQPRVFADRNFFGTILVNDRGQKNLPEYRELTHGRILHGIQSLIPADRTLATTYFAKGSGVDLALRYHPTRKKTKEGLRIGIVGLGAGTIASLAQDKDEIRFYEINPAMVNAAQKFFSFLQDSPARGEIVLGDARTSIEIELAQEECPYDLLILDAFNGDALPLHLVTCEAMDLYWKRLKPNTGAIVMNIANAYLDLIPVVMGLANESQKEYVIIEQKANLERLVYENRWAIISNSKELILHPKLQEKAKKINQDIKPIVWTDDWSNLFQVLRINN